MVYRNTGEKERDCRKGRLLGVRPLTWREDETVPTPASDPLVDYSSRTILYGGRSPKGEGNIF